MTISTAEFYDVQKCCAMTNHMWDGYWFLGNRGAWDQVCPAVVGPAQGGEPEMGEEVMIRSDEAADRTLRNRPAIPAGG